MNSFMQYKGYQGSVEYNDQDQVFYGKVMFIPSLLSYEGTDVRSLNRGFREAVDDYLDTCAAQNKSPETPFKGSFNVRTGPELHRKAVLYAKEHATNLNSLVTEALEHYLQQRTRNSNPPIPIPSVFEGH